MGPYPAGNGTALCACMSGTWHVIGGSRSPFFIPKTKHLRPKCKSILQHECLSVIVRVYIYGHLKNLSHERHLIFFQLQCEHQLPHTVVCIIAQYPVQDCSMLLYVLEWHFPVWAKHHGLYTCTTEMFQKQSYP